jgi:hypothetical protein
LGQIRFGAVDVAHMIVQIQEDPACLEQPEHPNQAAPAPVEDITSLAARVSHPEWFNVLEKWFTSQSEWSSKTPVSRVRVREIILDGSTLSGKSLLANGRADFSFQDELHLNLRLSPIEFKKKDRALTTNFTADIVANDKQIGLDADWSYDEGHVLLAMNYKNENQVADVSLKMRDLPLSVVNRWFDTPWAFQFLWFNCGLHLASGKETWNQSTWDVGDCKVSGPHGNVKVLSSHVRSIKNLQNVAFQISGFDLDKVIKGKNKVPLDGVFKSFGVVDGRAQINEGDFSSHLTLKNAEVIFSRRNQRKLQVIDEMKVELGYERSIYSIMINAAKIQGGVFDGFIALDYNKHLKRSSGKMSVEQLQFSPEVQQVMWDGRFTPFMMSGEITLDDEFRIDLAKASVGFKSYEAPGLTLSTGTVLLEWKKDGGQLSSSVAQLKVNREAGYPWLFAPFLDDGVNRDILVVSRILSQGHFVKSHLVLDKTVAQALNQRLEMTGDITKRNSEGELTWGVDPRRYRWKWLYTDQHFTLIPLEASMKEWLKLNDTYLEEYPFIRLENSEI